MEEFIYTGSMISLGVGTMEIDWERNSYFKDHSALFKPEDVKLIPYYYVGDDDKPLIIEKEGYSKKLKYVKKDWIYLGTHLMKSMSCMMK